MSKARRSTPSCCKPEGAQSPEANEDTFDAMPSCSKCGKCVHIHVGCSSKVGVLGQTGPAGYLETATEILSEKSAFLPRLPVAAGGALTIGALYLLLHYQEKYALSIISFVSTGMSTFSLLNLLPGVSKFLHSRIAFQQGNRKSHRIPFNLFNLDPNHLQQQRMHMQGGPGKEVFVAIAVLLLSLGVLAFFWPKKMMHEQLSSSSLSDINNKFILLLLTLLTAAVGVCVAYFGKNGIKKPNLNPVIQPILEPVLQPVVRITKRAMRGLSALRDKIMRKAAEKEQQKTNQQKKQK